MLHSSVQLLGPFCAFCSSVTWAVGSACYSRLSIHYSPFSINFARALWALPFFIVATFFESGGVASGIEAIRSLGWFHWSWLGLSILCSYGLGDAFFLLSARFLGITGALAISSCFPIWTVVAGYLFSGESVTYTQAVGLLLAIFGTVFIILHAPGEKTTERKRALPPFKGLALAFLTSILWAMNSFAAAKGGAGLSAPLSSLVRMSVGLLATAGCSRIFTPLSKVILPTRLLFRGFWFFFLEAFVGSYFFMYGISHSSLAVGSTLTSMAPVISVPFALLLGLEKFSALKTLGIAIVVAGICLLIGGF